MDDDRAKRWLKRTLRFVARDWILEGKPYWVGGGASKVNDPDERCLECGRRIRSLRWERFWCLRVFIPPLGVFYTCPEEACKKLVPQEREPLSDWAAMPTYGDIIADELAARFALLDDPLATRGHTGGILSTDIRRTSDG